MVTPHTPTVIERYGAQYLGTHLLVELWDCSSEALSDPEEVEAVLRRAASATGATIISGHFHHFGPNSGVTGVLVLSESHLSIHSWPELAYAALDVFVCGDCDPRKAVPELQSGFSAQRIQVFEQLRGILKYN